MSVTTGRFSIILILVPALALFTDLTRATSRDPGTSSSAGYLVRASEIGAVLNSDLMKGGGIDDTKALQAALDLAASGRPVHLLIDGVALVGGLDVYANTTIECINGGGMYLKDKSSRSIIRNKHRSRDAVIDTHIVLRGCFLNGNRKEQPGDYPDREPWGNSQKSDGTWITGLEFLGVNYLAIEDVSLLNVRSFGALIGNGERITVRNVIVDHGAPADVDWDYSTTDGLHFKGPLRYLTIDNVKLRTGDDGLAFNADDADSDDLTANNQFGPYVRHGPITDVSVSNVQLMDSLFGFRFLSKTQRIDRIVVSNVSGTIKGPRVAIISNWLGPSVGNIGSIEFTNVNVDRSIDARYVTRLSTAAARWREKSGENEQFKILYDEHNGGVSTLFSINCHAESIAIRNLRTTATDERPIVRVGPRGKVQQMTLEMSVLDTDLRAVPLELDEGSRIDRLSFSLDWRGKDVNASGNPIAFLGGSIGELRWVNTPPRYVSSVLSQANSITVRLTQDVRATNFSAGVRIEVNGKPAAILRSFRDETRPNLVHYTLQDSVGLEDRASWAYSAADGQIQNMSGNYLFSTPPMAVSGGTVSGSQ